MHGLILTRSSAAASPKVGRLFVEKHVSAPAVVCKLVALYEQEPRPVPARTFPDWLAFGDQLKIGRLDERIAVLEQ